MVKYLDNNSGFDQWNSLHPQKKPSRLSGIFWWVLLFIFAFWIMGGWFKPQNVEIVNSAPINIEQSTIEKQRLNNEDISFDVQGIRISNISLNKHKQDSKSENHVTLLNADNNFIEIGFISPDTKIPNINTKWVQHSDTMQYDNGSRVNFTRKISVDGYVITVSDTIKNNSTQYVSLAPYVQITKNEQNTTTSVVETGGAVYANSKLDYTHWKNLDKKPVAYSTVRGSLGFVEQYWETFATIDANDQTISLKKTGDLYLAQTNVAPIKIAPKQTLTINS